MVLSPLSWPVCLLRLTTPALTVCWRLLALFQFFWKIDCLIARSVSMWTLCLLQMVQQLSMRVLDNDSLVLRVKIGFQKTTGFLENLSDRKCCVLFPQFRWQEIGSFLLRNPFFSEMCGRLPFQNSSWKNQPPTPNRELFKIWWVITTVLTSCDYLFL